jgi:hypothetical protein
MKSFLAALLLLTLSLQSTTTLVLAVPSPQGSISPRQGGDKCSFFKQTGCPDTKFCIADNICISKFPAESFCLLDAYCLSGLCDRTGAYPVCAQQCSEQSQCPSGSTCKHSACVKPNQLIGTKCDENEECQSKTCFDSKCQPPNAKKVGDACDEKDSSDFCQLGSMCWKGSCSTRGYKSDGTLGGKCIVNGEYQCFPNTAYCDLSAGLTCQPKKSAAAPCALKVLGVNIPLSDQCFSDRCVEDGFCGTKDPGGEGEPCWTNEKVCREDYECRAGPGDGINGPKKTCQTNGLEGTPCKKDGGCIGDLLCYRGSGDPGTCLRWGSFQGKPCKSEDQCAGGADRETVWTNFGAYDGVDGGWGTRKTEIGFLCSSSKCKFVHNVVDDTKPIKKD